MVRPKFWPDCTRRSGDTLMPHTPSHVLLNFICQSVVFIVPSAFALIRSLGVIGSQSCRTVWTKNCAALRPGLSEELRRIGTVRPQQSARSLAERRHGRPAAGHAFGGRDLPRFV